MEIIMSVKIIATLAAAVLLGTTALASAAEPGTHSPHHHAGAVPHGAVSLQDPYAGTPFENLVPYGSENLPDPYAGTVFDGVAPY
jgi:hypothetical protein